MDCRTVMAPMKVDLFADEKVGDVMDFMIEKHMGLVPVMNRDGTFAGLISGDFLMTYMIPRTLSTVGTGVRRAHMKHASYLDETAEEMQERLDELREMQVGDVLEKDVETVSPDTPLIDALMKIKSKQYVVPVVDDTGKLIGAISFFSVLYALREQYDRSEVDRKHGERREHHDGSPNGEEP